MSLNKSICQSCFKSAGQDWTPDDEGLWRNGMVYCPRKLRDAAIINKTVREHFPLVNEVIEYEPFDTNQPPPDTCEYKLEHMVCGDN